MLLFFKLRYNYMNTMNLPLISTIISIQISWILSYYSRFEIVRENIHIISLIHVIS